VIELVREEQGQHATKASLTRAGIPGDPMLKRLLFALVESQEALRPTLRW
jgi:hypothetical protein